MGSYQRRWHRLASTITRPAETTMASSSCCKVFCFSLLLAAVFASPVVSKLGEDLHFDIPAVSHEVIDKLTVSISGGTVDVKNFSVKLTKPGLAEANADLVDFEIPKYTVDGWESAFKIHGDGLISLKVYPSINVTYTPSPASSDCALANSTKYSVHISKIEAKITGLKLDLTNIDSVAESYIEGHCSTIAKLLEDNMNTNTLHQYVDPWTVNEINSVCTKTDSSVPSVDVEKFLSDVLEAAVTGVVHAGSN